MLPTDSVRKSTADIVGPEVLSLISLFSICFVIFVIQFTLIMRQLSLKSGERGDYSSTVYYQPRDLVFTYNNEPRTYYVHACTCTYRLPHKKAASPSLSESSSDSDGESDMFSTSFSSARAAASPSPVSSLRLFSSASMISRKHYEIMGGAINTTRMRVSLHRNRVTTTKRIYTILHKNKDTISNKIIRKSYIKTVFTTIHQI